MAYRQIDADGAAKIDRKLRQAEVCLQQALEPSTVDKSEAIQDALRLVTEARACTAAQTATGPAAELLASMNTAGVKHSDVAGD